MIPVIQDTLMSLEQDIVVKTDQFINKLDIEGVFGGKVLALIYIIKKLLLDENVSDNDKLRLNMKLLDLKNIKIY